MILKLSFQQNNDVYDISQENVKLVFDKYGNKTNVLWKINLFIKTFLDILKSIPTGKIFSNYLLRRNRLKICKECENYNKKIKICKICGCVSPIKSTFESAKCPINKW